MTNLPSPSKLEESVHDALNQRLKKEIIQSGGSISFSLLMDIVLYDEEHGYYTGYKEQFGESGDFITAPMISNIFTRCFLNSFKENFLHLPSLILELGAGNGQFAVDLLIAAEKNNIVINQYFIYEISKNLVKRQQKVLQKELSKEIFSKVVWVSEIPENFEGIIFANEFLDAFPTNIYEVKNKQIYERKVGIENNQLNWKRDDKPNLELESTIDIENLPTGYIFEYSKNLDEWLKTFFKTIKKAMIFFVDYGFCQNELFHQDRMEGTLMCHYKHYAHTNPFAFLGAQDITWHVNFSHISRLAKSAGCKVSGFVSQANFLINTGALDFLSEHDPNNISDFKIHTNAFQRLTSPAEMGDLVKVIGIIKNTDASLFGFNNNDRKFQL
ncbi:SAM-dependent methyltransferase [Methylophilaceae bacterium]|nr:SAM-dependent methyltransferase [Methylophilaceae bacterium]|tara:strand:+ start:1239 stop:2393 length:1155 start_codon:yes stop_codon:yes gene_type:complete